MFLTSMLSSDTIAETLRSVAKLVHSQLMAAEHVFFISAVFVKTIV